MTTGTLSLQATIPTAPVTSTSDLNLTLAPQLHCHEPLNCGRCESCSFTCSLTSIDAWFSRAGDASKRRVLIGLITRMRSGQLLRQLAGLVRHVGAGKDAIYARARMNPALDVDLITLGGDRAMDRSDLDSAIQRTFDWFEGASDWIKLNFLLHLLSNLKSYMVNDAYKLVTAVLNTNVYTEGVLGSDSAPSPEVGQCDIDQLLLEYVPDLDRLYRGMRLAAAEDDVDDEGDLQASRDERGEMGEERPTRAIQLLFHQAVEGVDFIRRLPVHISKFIINLLDEKSVKQCLLVSSHWRWVSQQVLLESVINQQVREETKLFQTVTANAVNPFYAKDVDVPVPNCHPRSHKVVYYQAVIDDISTDPPPLLPSPLHNDPDSQIECDTARRSAGGSGKWLKSECSLTNAYRGVSTRLVIMEERNVFCGPYSVLILVEGPPFNRPDPTRVAHTDGGQLVALGNGARLLRFVHVDNGPAPNHRIHGHAGSVRVVHLCESLDILLSGSYDTSVRAWSIATGKCQRIYRGHTGSVLALDVCGERFASGGADATCRIWLLAERKPLRTFRHRHSVTAVGLSDALCVSGDQSGRVKVWDSREHRLIKILLGHNGEVTAVKFDRFHILTASKDGYVLMWSAVGDITACLGSFRHPKPVLCLEFRYLRAITGCEDGRLRIWNVLTGQCCRILRGNSRSDPIINLIADDNRIVINTCTTVLALNFEPIQWRHDLASTNQLESSPTTKRPPVRRPRPPSNPVAHSHARAARARLIGSADARILRQSSDFGVSAGAGTASASAAAGDSGPVLHVTPVHRELRIRSESTATAVFKEPQTPAANTTVCAPEQTDASNLTTGPLPPPTRRVSYGFERPDTGSDHNELGAVKTLLRSQLRMSAVEAAGDQPHFILTSVMRLRGQDQSPPEQRRTTTTRPMSGPSRVDSRSKMALTEINQWLRRGHQLVPQQQLRPDSCASSTPGPATGDGRRNTNTMTCTSFDTIPLLRSAHQSRHSAVTPTTIPAPRLLRPHSAAPLPTKCTTPASMTCMPVSQPPPMKMYPKNLLDNLKVRKAEFDQRQQLFAMTPTTASGSGGSDLHLRTFDEELIQLRQIEAQYERDRLQAFAKEEAERRRRWLAMATVRPRPMSAKL